jgi:hypothetical protein
LLAEQANGLKFENTRTQGMGENFFKNGLSCCLGDLDVIKGWSEAIPTMRFVRTFLMVFEVYIAFVESGSLL